MESLRALAALGVLVSHASYALATGGPDWLFRSLRVGGWGVDVFFVLSGYLLFWPFVRAALGGERIDLRRYAVNRALRILPLYYAVLALLLVVQHGGGTLTEWWRYGLFAENFFPGQATGVDPPMWSLVVEVQFYLVLPLLGAGLLRVARSSAWRAALAVAGLGVAGLVLWQWLAVGHGSDTVRYTLPARMWFFAPGMLLAVLRWSWEQRPPSRLRGWLAEPLTWWLASLPLWALDMRSDRYEAAAALAGFLVVGSCVLPLRPGRSSRLLGALQWRPLALLGIASYSLYLLHDPVLIALENGSLTSPVPANRHGFVYLILLGVPLSCALAALSYRLVESPFLRFRRRWAASSAGGNARPAPAAAWAARPLGAPTDAAVLASGTEPPVERTAYAAAGTGSGTGTAGLST